MKSRAADAAIESLDRCERIPGEYFVLRVEDLEDAARVLQCAGIRTRILHFEGREHPWLSIENRPYLQRHQLLKPGDCVTFRRWRRWDGWSVITYRRDEFESRYRRARTSPIGEAAGEGAAS
ncbi:MAG: hypothetical protein OXN97_06655 [Bryobacterales bacterium]|nr:hypothetical protein [Bryobacterales bacterium]